MYSMDTLIQNQQHFCTFSYLFYQIYNFGKKNYAFLISKGKIELTIKGFFELKSEIIAIAVEMRK